jgi:hypothetical protein
MLVQTAQQKKKKMLGESKRRRQYKQQRSPSFNNLTKSPVALTKSRSTSPVNVSASPLATSTLTNRVANKLSPNQWWSVAKKNNRQQKPSSNTIFAKTIKSIKKSIDDNSENRI